MSKHSHSKGVVLAVNLRKRDDINSDYVIPDTPCRSPLYSIQTELSGGARLACSDANISIVSRNLEIISSSKFEQSFQLIEPHKIVQSSGFRIGQIYQGTGPRFDSLLPSKLVFRVASMRAVGLTAVFVDLISRLP